MASAAAPGAVTRRLAAETAGSVAKGENGWRRRSSASQRGKSSPSAPTAAAAWPPRKRCITWQRARTSGPARWGCCSARRCSRAAGQWGRRRSVSVCMGCGSGPGLACVGCARVTCPLSESSGIRSMRWNRALAGVAVQELGLARSGESRTLRCLPPSASRPTLPLPSDPSRCCSSSCSISVAAAAAASCPRAPRQCSAAATTHTGRLDVCLAGVEPLSSPPQAISHSPATAARPPPPLPPAPAACRSS